MAGFKAASGLTLAAMSIAVSSAFGPATAGTGAPCETVKQRGELQTLKRGDIIYADLAAKIRIRIKSIDIEKKEICGRTRRTSKCFGVDKVYTGRALAACGRGAPPSAILLFDESEETAEDTDDRR
ncbi:MAG: hypothetical protein GC152_03955 [Alphaproteobacteria bacterium]|nr:hypothetical protein [Alphaproteobacteria bacterium]